MSSSQWNYQEYSGSRGVTLVTVTVLLSSGGDDVEGVLQGGCDGSLDITKYRDIVG
jgi:hypothetical protein